MHTMHDRKLLQAPLRAIRAALFYALIALTGATLWPQAAQAGFLFRGTQPILFIPPTNLGQPRIIPTFAPNAPTILNPFIQACPRIPGSSRLCTFAWRIGLPGQPFFPVNQGVPLIMDNTQYLSTNPFVTPAGVWGIWDPPVVTVNDIIDVFEIFAGADPLATPNAVEDTGIDQALAFDGYPDVDFSRFPDEVIFQVPLPLDLGITLLSNDIIGNMTGTIYPGTLYESDFSTLAADLAAVSTTPGATFDLDNIFAGPHPASGRVVFAHHLVPAGEVVLFAEVPEPKAALLAALLALLSAAAWQTRVARATPNHLPARRFRHGSD
ncbi:MAG: hypothetical protein KF778_06110 [Rhodocyclaceae bacterium]|nr:hypothetical protein [Rhodocyclaceae bacterium]MBX3667960.1 hypothetical protein [Rhodocyclaceae bacterium]